MKTRSTRSSISRRVNQEKPRLYQAETLNKADEEMNELMIITVSRRIEKHCNSSVDTSKRGRDAHR
ncbi:unnamed product [Ostreococcus tauri]|uniref:Unnamed product n=1 Tax=Ostreococcus tauri TaxID=70448 RepID=A0A090N3I6_OSTTA|nr:unnamed product [Ostreococcus tauri]CEF98183.1 unnamed product [Ostreococcus tauri]|eukprot:XP_022839125.1 unnamed product [Ostreococcus tauri]